MIGPACHPDCVVCNQHREPHDFQTLVWGEGMFDWRETHPSRDDDGNAWVEYIRTPVDTGVPVEA